MPDPTQSARTLIFAAALLTAACSTPEPPVSAPGVKRLSSVDTGKPRVHAAKHRPSRRHLSPASRSLRRTALESRWDHVAACESSGNWHITNPPYSGGLQFTASTWASFGGLRYAATAALASRLEQIRVAERVLAAQGPGAWPICSWGVLR